MLLNRKASAGGLVPPGFRYHRLRCVNNYQNTGWRALVIGEMQFRATSGGAKLVGTYTGSNVQLGLVGQNANDGDPATFYQGGSGIAAPFTCTETLTMDMGLGNYGEVTEVAISPISGGDGLVYSPQTFVIETSSDGSTWSTNWTVTAASFGGWTHGVLRVFTKP